MVTRVDVIITEVKEETKAEGSPKKKHLTILMTVVYNEKHYS